MSAEPSDGGITMLEGLQYARILKVELKGTESVCLTDCCSEYFSVTLTKAEFAELIAELSALLETMTG